MKLYVPLVRRGAGLRNVFVMGAVLLAGSLACRADVVTMFNVNGTWDNGSLTGPGGTLTGTITIDVTTGVATGIDVVETTTAASTSGATSNTFSGIGAQGPGNMEYIVQSGGVNLFTELIFPTDSLIGYAGGNLCSLQNSCSGDFTRYGLGAAGPVLESGTVTPVSAATPEPSSLALLGTGVLGFAGVLRRRRCC